MSYLIPLLVGLAVGILYALIGVRSPAPPIIALVGLLGMVMGEQAIPLARAHLWPKPERAASSSCNDPQPTTDAIDNASSGAGPRAGLPPPAPHPAAAAAGAKGS